MPEDRRQQARVRFRNGLQQAHPAPFGVPLPGVRGLHGAADALARVRQGQRPGFLQERDDLLLQDVGAEDRVVEVDDGARRVELDLDTLGQRSDPTPPPTPRTTG